MVPVLEVPLRLGPRSRGRANSVHNVRMASRKRDLDVAPAEDPDVGRATGARPLAPPTRVVFVCTGNICRSPMAEVVLRALAAGVVLADGSKLGDRVVVSSAGTTSWHEGEPMNPRARSVLEARGYTDHGHVAQAFETAWLESTDLVVCLDRGHRQTLAGLGRAAVGDDRYEARLVLLRSFDERAGGSVDVPDPYNGDEIEFEDCLDMVEAGCRGLTEYLVRGYDAAP
jgi:low molecular weight protein-tyrosine phosphatase